MAFFAQLPSIGDDQQGILNGDAQDGDKAHGRRNRKIGSRQIERDDAAARRHRYAEQHNERVTSILGRAEHQKGDDQQGDGHDDKQALRGLLQLVHFTSPLEVRVVGQFLYNGRNARLGFTDGRPEVAPAHGELHRHVALQILAKYYRRALFLDHLGDLTERHLSAIGRGHQDVANGAHVAPVLFRPAQDEVEMLFSFEDLRDDLPANRCLHHRRDVASVEPVAANLRSIGRNTNGRLTKRAEDAQILDTRNLFEHIDDVLGLGLVDMQIRAHDLDRVLALDPRHGLLDVVGNGLRETEHHAGKGRRQLFLHSAGHRFLGDALAPFAGGPQGRKQLDVVEARHIGAVVGPSELRDCGLDLGTPLLSLGAGSVFVGWTAAHNSPHATHHACGLFQRD